MHSAGISNDLIFRAAELVAAADGLIITAGAGMGVDSGLPDFRGNDGFWKHYPALAKAQISFTDIACPETFEKNPKLAWGFYGHRLNLYRNTAPHRGFSYLRTIGERLEGGVFVYTSNVDGQFQKSGLKWDQIVECHGSIHLLQCQNTFCQDIWKATEFMPIVDEDECILISSFPLCKDCNGIARPNIPMFDDTEWASWRTRSQRARFDEWRQTVHRPVVIELGAGDHIPTVRRFGQSLDVPLIRINPTDANVDRPTDVAIQMGALEAIAGITQKMIAMGFIKPTNDLCAMSHSV